MTKVKHLVLMGASTGGPKALQKILSSLDEMEEAAILIVQHMPPLFTRSLAKRLDRLTHHRVVEAQHEELVQPGSVYIAPGGWHLEVSMKHRHLVLCLNQKEPREGHRPSVNILLESASHIPNVHFIPVILTGMGKDGTEGLKKLSQTQRVSSIAEHPSTAVIYGMPKSVIEENLVDEIVPLDGIHKAIERLIE